MPGLEPEFRNGIISFYKGRWKEAYERLSRTNPFPQFTGRGARPAPCEGGCIASIVNDSVTIKNIERAIIDKAFAEGWVSPQIPTQQTGKKVDQISALALLDSLCIYFKSIWAQSDSLWSVLIGSAAC